MSPARIALLAAAAGLLIFSCGREKPSTPDGQNDLTLFAVDTSNVSGLGWIGVPEATIKISSETFSYEEEFLTDLDGKVVIRNLPAGTYNIMAELINTEENFMILGQASRSLLFDPEPVDTVYMTYQQSSPLVINELYFVGCSYSYFYYYDQFIELYNSSNDTLYLDGIFVVRGTHIEDIIDIEAEDYALGYYVYKFPGEYGVTRNSPLGPKEFTVIATDAIDHSRINARCVNLLNSDWEFFLRAGGRLRQPDRGQPRSGEQRRKRFHDEPRARERVYSHRRGVGLRDAFRRQRAEGIHRNPRFHDHRRR